MRISTRFRTMLEQGFEQEVRHLLARGDLSPGLSSLRTVGYRQMVHYLLGAGDHARMVEEVNRATRQLAKRQLTWLRAEPGAHWLHDEDGEVEAAAYECVRAWL
jgi:tRNA dimethylallyltransferase